MGAEHEAAPMVESRERAKAGPATWQTAVHRGSQALSVAMLGLALVLGYRYAETYGRIEPATTGPALVPILVALLGFVLALAAAVLRPERGDTGRLIGTAAVWSLALLVALACVWYLIETGVRDDPVVGQLVTSQSEVDAYLARHLPTSDPGAAMPFLIPTGVMVQSFEFENAFDVEVAGYVWQKYAPSVPPEVTRGFVLPEAEEAYAVEEVYRFTAGDGTEVIGWFFHATLRHSFDYRRYPFDRQDIWLRLWPHDFGRRALLVPDFASYDDLDPRTLPGLEEQFVYDIWEPEYAAFSYAINRYNASFGFDPTIERTGFPELYFNLGLKRSFVSPFFDHIVLAIVVALLLFAILILTATDEDRRQRFGISTYGVLSSCSVVLFAVIVKHGQIRSSVSPQQITYLETLPFILYLAIILVVSNAILLVSPIHLELVEYRNNILPSLLYWPLLLGLLLTVTLFTFYW